MEDIKYFEDLFKSIPDYKKIVLLCFIIKQDINLLREFGMSENFINELYKQFKKIAENDIDEYNYHIKNLEESILERF